MAFAPDGKHVLTGSRDLTARLWDVQSGKELRAFTGHATWVSSVAFSPDGMQVLTCIWDPYRALTPGTKFIVRDGGTLSPRA